MVRVCAHVHEVLCCSAGSVAFRCPRLGLRVATQLGVINYSHQDPRLTPHRAVLAPTRATDGTAHWDRDDGIAANALRHNRCRYEH